MRFNKTIVFFSTFFFLSSFNLEAYEEIPNEQFACYSNFNSMMVSPDGRHLLIINTVKDNICDIEQDKVKRIEDSMRDRGLLLLDLDTMETTMISDGSSEGGINGAGWLSSNRIWYTPRYKTGQDIDSRVTFAMNIDGSRRTVIKKGGYWYQSIYDYDYDDPNHVYVQTNERRQVIFDYYRLNIFTGKKTRIAYGPDIGNMKGKAVLGSLNDFETKLPLGMLIDVGLDRVLYAYNSSNKEWEEHFRFACQQPGFTPIGTYKGKVVVSGSKFSPSGTLIEENDTNAIYLYDMNTREFSDKLYQDPRYDVSGLTGSCRQASGYKLSSSGSSEISAIAYESYQQEAVFFDKEQEATYIAIKQLFPGDQIEILSSDVSGKVMMVLVQGSNNPGDYYIVDLYKNSVNLLYQERPWLDRSKLAKTTAVKYYARDGLEIPALLTLTKKETDKNYFVILPHGGPNTKQRIGYDTWAQFFANKGINVLQPDFRGSTGLGTKHYKAGNLEWGKKMQDDITDGVMWAIENGYADADTVCIAGASYGGYATMAGLVFTPDLYRCGINSVGVTDQQQLLDNFAAKASRFQSWDEEPLLEWGDMSTEEGQKYAKEISPILHVDNIKAPVLVLHGTNDPIVPVFHARDLIAKLEKLGKEYDSMFQAYEEHCVVSCGELANLEFLNVQEEFLDKYLFN
jgi:dienelactone hydrolase|tara:strand:- start:210 stop:2255 length:2046 start_codon:yes stop_codon:yes gene_type:complete